MEKISYVSMENITFDQVDTVIYVIWKVQSLKDEGYPNDFVIEFIESDDDLTWDRRELRGFLEKTLNNYK